MKFKFTLFSKKPGQESFKKEKDPAKDWKLIIMSFMALNLAVLAIGAYTFWSVNSGSLFESSNLEPLIKDLNTKDLGRIIEEFSKKEILHATHSAQKAAVPDPSL